MVTRRGSSDENDDGRQAFWDQASHDLRQPVQSLQLLSRIFARHADSEPLRQAADHMSRAVAGLARMQDELIRLSRLESERSVPERRVVNIRGLVRDAVRELAVKERQVDVDAESIASRAEADPQWLSLVLRAMLLLALRYAEGGAVRVHGDSRNASVSVVVTFEGQEISAKEAGRVFFDADGPGESQSILGPGYLSRACELLGYRFRIGAAGQGRQEIGLTLTSNRRSC